MPAILSPRGHRRQAHAGRLLSLIQELRTLGYQDDREDAAAAGLDLFMTKGRSKLAIILRDAPDARLDHLRSRLADALLSASAACAFEASAGAMPVAVVGVPRVTPSMVQRVASEVEGFVAALKPKQFGWGMVDDAGLVALHVGALHYERASDPEPRPAAARAFDPFSDRGQWVLKVLIASRLPDSLINGVFREHALSKPWAQATVPRHAYQLGPKAGVSTPTADRVVRWLRQEGHVDPDGSDLALRRVPELLARWRGRYAGPGTPIAAMWRQRPRDPRAHLHEQLRHFADSRTSAGFTTAPSQGGGGLAIAQPRACLASFSACDALGLGIVMGIAPRIYLERPSVNLESIGLRRARPVELPDALVFAPPHPESIFRAHVIRDGVAVADVLQCWLDLAHERARGEEQAQALVAGPLAALFAEDVE